MPEYRYTRDKPYNSQCPKDFGYYIMAKNLDDALTQIEKMFPHDTTFQISLWE